MSRFIVSPKAASWVEVPQGSHFPIQNLPLCIFAHANADEPVLGTRIGDKLIDLGALMDLELLSGPEDEDEAAEFYEFGYLDPRVFRQVRKGLYDILRVDNPKLRDDKSAKKEVFVDLADADVLLPAEVRAFVDFYSGIHHASNVGRMFRPDQPPLLPNYRHLPIGYNGRASSVVVDGASIRRPNVQTKGPNDELPSFGPTRELDFELELGFFVGMGTNMGEAIPIGDCEELISGVVLVNDWSARDTQRWEYQPLGPFLAKSFATSISPYLVSLDALEPFRVDGMPQEPAVLPHLRAPKASHYDIELEVSIQSPSMKQPQVICRSNAKNLYWSFVQQLAHQSSNGTPLETGDLYATGTISGEAEGTFGSMLELTWRGSKPIVLSETGEERTFLEDGDVVTMSGWAQGEGYRVGLGTVSGRVEPAS
jgi:fumarylacetoacetase